MYYVINLLVDDKEKTFLIDADGIAALEEVIDLLAQANGLGHDLISINKVSKESIKIYKEEL